MMKDVEAVKAAVQEEEEVEDPGFESQCSSDVHRKSTRLESCSSSTG